MPHRRDPSPAGMGRALRTILSHRASQGEGEAVETRLLPIEQSRAGRLP